MPVPSIDLLTWAIFYLCTEPARLRLVQRELDEQLQGKAPTFEQTAQLRYLRFVIKETLRLQPSAPLRGRTLTQDTTVGKWRVAAGTDFLYSPWALHRLPSTCLDLARSSQLLTFSSSTSVQRSGVSP